MRVTADLCNQQGIAFIPESMGGLHKVTIQQLRKLGSALMCHTGTDESESINHLMTRTLQKGLSALLLNPTTPLQPSEESSKEQANINCVSLLTNNNDKPSLHKKKTNSNYI